MELYLNVKLTLSVTRLLTPKILLLLGGIIALNVTSNPDSQNLELVGHLTTPARSFCLQEDYVYLAAGEEGLKIVDISDFSPNGTAVGLAAATLATATSKWWMCRTQLRRFKQIVLISSPTSRKCIWK